MDSPAPSQLSIFLKWLFLTLLAGLCLVTFALIIIYGYKFFTGEEKNDHTPPASVSPTANPSPTTLPSPTTSHTPTATPSVSLSPNRLTPTASTKLTPTPIISTITTSPSNQ